MRFDHYGVWYLFVDRLIALVSSLFVEHAGIDIVLLLFVVDGAVY